MLGQGRQRLEGVRIIELGVMLECVGEFIGDCRLMEQSDLQPDEERQNTGCFLPKPSRPHSLAPLSLLFFVHCDAADGPIPGWRTRCPMWLRKMAVASDVVSTAERFRE